MISSSSINQTMQRHYLCKITPLPTSVVFLLPTVEISTKQKCHSFCTMLIVSCVKFDIESQSLKWKTRATVQGSSLSLLARPWWFLKKGYTKIIHDWIKCMFTNVPQDVAVYKWEFDDAHFLYSGRTYCTRYRYLVHSWYHAYLEASLTISLSWPHTKTH